MNRRHPTRAATLAFLLSTFAAACAPSLPASDPHALLQQTPAPLLQQTLAGATVKLPDAGHVTVIDVWQTSCTPCVAMMPELELLWQRGRAAGVQVVGVAVDDNPGLVQAKLVERGVSYPNVVDAEGEVRGWLHVVEVPATFVFDRRGRVRWVHKGGGPGDVATVGRAVDALLREGEGP